MNSIPTPENITAQWFAEVLSEHGFDVDVVGVKASQIGTGQIGKCIRYQLDLRGDKNAPTTLVGKFPSDNELSRSTGVMLQNYLKEVCFYQSLQSRLSIVTPKCYFAQINGVGPEFMLLLEDMHPASQGNQLSGCTLEVATAAVLDLVGLHAPSWNDESLRGSEWLGEPSEESGQMVRALYQAQLPGFLDRYGASLSSEQVDIIAALGDSNLLAQALANPFSLVHIDYRLDNLLINTALEPVQTIAVDWQSITLGNPMTDVAYFIGAGLLADVRRAEEEAIVRLYHSALIDAGVQQYSWQDCWRDYRKASFAGFSVTVIASMLVQQTQRGDEMFIAMAKRHSTHAIDLQGQEFL